uniref:SpoIIE family protein phosphatase n=1 Tax=Streptomyces polyasparticus TaxID=2767826 RepID=UPI00280C3A91|nr:SpoIIE family protein phosphatase [Streptomyces polyasparticus]
MRDQEAGSGRGAVDAPGLCHSPAFDWEAILAAVGPADPAVGDAIALLRGVLEGTEAGIAVFDTELRYRYVNPHLAHMTGLPAEAHLGRTPADVIPQVKRSDELLRAVLTDGRPRQMILAGRTRADSPYRRREWRATYHRINDREGRAVALVGIGLEVSGPRQYLHELERAHQRLALLDAAVAKIGTTTDVATTCQELADAAVPGLADAAGVELRPDEASAAHEPAPKGVLRLRRTALAVRPELGHVPGLSGPAGSYIDYQPGAAIRQCLESGRSWLRNRLSPPEWRALAAQPELADAYLAAGIHSALVVPLAADGHVLGTLSLARAGTSPPFSSDDAVVARQLAARTGRALERTLRFNREHAMALELQRALLAEPGRALPALDTEARYLPADNQLLVGGDWYDTVALDDGRGLLAIGDVMGHGVEAAVAMSHYRSMLRALAQTGLPPHEILRHADRMVADSGFDRVATCLLVLADLRNRTASYASAGHLPPVWFSPQGRASLVPVPVGPPLGTGLGRYPHTTTECLDDGILLLYTDGLIERRDEDIDASLKRLTDLGPDTTGPLNTFLDQTLSALAPEGTDDIALLAARARTA